MPYYKKDANGFPIMGGEHGEVDKVAPAKPVPKPKRAPEKQPEHLDLNYRANVTRRQTILDSIDR